MTRYYVPCEKCGSVGKISSISKRMQSRYTKLLKQFEDAVPGAMKPKPLVPHTDICRECSGRGIVPSESFPPVNIDMPKVAIIGGGIAGMALAIACLHRGISYTLYERDETFDARSQGYGLTLQQASKALEGLGIPRFEKGITSIMHIVHDEKGKIIGQWGRRNIDIEKLEKNTKRRNVHLPRQVLREDLRNALTGDRGVCWGYNLKNISRDSIGKFILEFEAHGKKERVQADLVVGADGIRSSVRNIIFQNDPSPLRYLGCIVILGICSLDAPGLGNHSLLDGETVFQTVNGHERIYMMPFDEKHIMWQLSFPLSEEDAKVLSKKGPEALKQEGIARLGKWHTPIPEILQATDVSLITGYPVYDRQELNAQALQDFGNVTLIGDAMHPMSPFKGQGANQAILDALELARSIYTKCGPGLQWREKGLRKTLLEDFEKQMGERSALKVRDSARQAELLHSDAVLHDGDMPRGRGI